ncbi:type 1 glutamine amidotransferase domain-containing protein [Prosthecomicrobium sp. N25]|uniref:type 1 glutamine amidotransferase domain-containing protein n=1 Tax=Prosthecomicrobium sp. N25 TaxID=3129254 RepID=UPI003076A204
MQKIMRALIVATSHDRLGDTGKPTGFYWEELATPYRVFREAGFEVDIASIRGGEPAADPKSEPSAEEPLPDVVAFKKDEAAMGKLRRAPSVQEVVAADYDVVFLAGGHGAVWDMPGDPALAALLGDVHARGGVVSAVCHGPAGLVGAKGTDGAPLVAGKRVAGFTNEEETAVGLTEVVPFLLETRLGELGAFFEPGPAFKPKVVRDGRLVTGQNPMSSEATAERAVEAARDTVGR